MRSGLKMIKTSEPARSNEWATPPRLFRALSQRFGGFTLDAAAAEWNAKCLRFFTKEQDALKRRWSGRVWLNPPYCDGLVEPFMQKARAEVLAGRAELVCCLVPGYTADGWWHRQVEAPAGRLVRLDHQIDDLGTWNIVRWRDLEVRICKLRGRVTFKHQEHAQLAAKSKSSARHSSVVVTFINPREHRA